MAMGMATPRAGPATDAKSQLNCFLQRHCKKSINRQDVVYSVAKYGDSYQATVTLNCMDGVQFAGEVASTKPLAEHNAAAIALGNYPNEYALAMSQQKAGGNKSKRKAGEAGLGPGRQGELANYSHLPDADTPIPAGADSMRVVLNNTLMRYLKRPLVKDDVIYSTAETALGFQCTVSMPCLEGEWAGLGWAGEVSAKKKLAEEYAAKQAVDALASDPSLQEFMIPPGQGPAKKKKKSSGSGGGGGGGGGMEDGFDGGGGGKGKGKGGFGFGSPLEFMGMLAGMGFDFSIFKGMMKGKGKGKDKGKFKGKMGKGPSGPKPRTPVSDDPMSGTIVEWKGKYGWIQPSDPIEHEMSSKNKGRIFLHKQDWDNDTVEPEEGSVIQFRVYEDATGLGAEGATLL